MATKVRPFNRSNSKKYIRPQTFKCPLFLLIFAFFNILHFQLFLEVTALEDVMNEATFTIIGWKMCREALTAVTYFNRFLLNNLGLVFLENLRTFQSIYIIGAFLNDYSVTFLSYSTIFVQELPSTNFAKKF